MPPASRNTFIAGCALLGGVAIAFGWLDPATNWFAAFFRGVAHLFYEQSALAEIRAPSQLILSRYHIIIFLCMIGCGAVASPWLSRHARIAVAVFCVGYAIRAGFWIAGGNLPLVPGDCCHYVEIAASVDRGAGPTKHYVESFFVDYRKHGFNTAGRVLDDWATPLWAYVLAGCYRLAGVVPGASLAATFAVVKGASFLLNVLTLPALYLFCRRFFGARLALLSMALLAVLPVHALYAGFGLRESLVALTALIAVWGMFELLRLSGWRAVAAAMGAGAAAGLAILARNTSLVLVACLGVYALITRGRHMLGRLLLWGVVILATIAPWAWATWQEYGEPFFTYTKYYPYNFSWTVHHFDQGNTNAAQFFTAGNAAAIARVKIKSIFIVLLYSTMILSAPLVLSFAAALRGPRRPEGASPPLISSYGRLILMTFTAFLAATLVQISDITQVQQLGRYYMPIFVLMTPVCAAGLLRWGEHRLDAKGWAITALVILGALWSNPTWAHDASWFLNPYQTRWPALSAAGEWIRNHPQEVPPDARILTWFPWEMRVAGDRSTVLFPRALEAGEYEARRVLDTMRNYGVTHVLWGSFEPGSTAEPEALGRYLEALRAGLGLTDSHLLWKSEKLPHGVRLYRVAGEP